MARKVFYSFHFKRDAWRVGQVRNSNILSDDDEYGVIDGVDWEKIEREGDKSIKRWINDQLKNTSVTAIIIGAETAERDWVNYEIRQSWERGNGLLGIRVHNVKDQEGKTDSPGLNPLDEIYLVDGIALSSICKTYDWVLDDGRENMGKWIEESFQDRARRNSDEKLKEDSEKTLEKPITIRNPSGPWLNND